MASAKAQGKRRAEPDLLLAPPTKRYSTSSFRASRYSSGFGHTTEIRKNGHFGCVNALACSTKDGGRWMASGGDDCRVLLWDCFDELSQDTKPKAVFTGASSNIFSIDHSCDGAKVFSCGNDEAIMMHDIETGTMSSSLAAGTRPEDAWRHDASVRGVSCHPQNPFLFLSASEDGTCGQYDLRQPNFTGIVAETCEFNDVKYNPVLPHQFLTADSWGRVLLHDSRVTFGHELKVASSCAVLSYHTSLVRITPPPIPDPLLGPDPHLSFAPQRLPHHISCRFETSSLAFDPSGQTFVANISKHRPTLFKISDPEPLASFGSPLSSGGRSGYSSVCTTKHGSFGGSPDQLYYAAGSDDFKTYIWRVPKLVDLEAIRTHLEPKEHEPEKFEPLLDSGPPWWIGYEAHAGPGARERAEDQNPTIPPVLDSPSSVLSTHRTIVNTALFHPTLPLLLTSGVGKPIHVHRAGSADTSSFKFVPREPTPRNDTNTVQPWDSTEEDLATLSFFDYLLLRDREKFADGKLWELGEQSDSDSDDESDDGGEEEEAEVHLEELSDET